MITKTYLFMIGLFFYALLYIYNNYMIYLIRGDISMAISDVYRYIDECNFKVHNDYKRRYKIYQNTLKRSVGKRNGFNSTRLINKTKDLIKNNSNDIICNITFKWINKEFIPYDVNIQPYTKEVHIRVLLSQALIIFSLLNTPKTITSFNVYDL